MVTFAVDQAPAAPVHRTQPARESLECTITPLQIVQLAARWLTPEAIAEVWAARENQKPLEPGEVGHVH